ncbi:hypothetical protein [Abyssalbus ytuae]|uniref:50S ribosomal protein L27 n=1 Tax=Abyssalbus ytuae TaxID=2926907 RepID=A0A9E7A185_9FLAO|nr:hypothetical protein [Abyssalbus ytuae]UOB19132.1 hypothetical protein MQE35_07500 [Abyssalbus ytuae]
MTIIQLLHSYWAYFTLLILAFASLNALAGYFGNKEFKLSKDLRISLFALIFSHIQLLLGLILYLVSPNALAKIQSSGIGELSSFERLLALEHPLINIIAVTLITIGWSKHKKQQTSKGKFGKIALFYTIGLVLILSRIPWSIWFD